MAESRHVNLAPTDFGRLAESIRVVLSKSRPRTPERAWCADLTQRLGFDGCTYLLVRAGTAGTELLRHWTSAGGHWKVDYRRSAFQLVDPRVTLTVDRSAPVAWRTNTSARDPRERAFHLAATACGICGGFAMSIHQPHGVRAIVAWDSSTSSDTAAFGLVAPELASLALLACTLVDRIGSCPVPKDRATSLSPVITVREQECLAHASRGLTSHDIAHKVGIAERTVNFHIGNVVRKLGAVNRAEAIARGISLNLIGPGG